MKLYLVILFLSFLAFARSGSKSRPVVKFLCESSERIVIVESRDVMLSYKFEENKLKFYVQYIYKGHTDELILRHSAQNLSYAVELNVKGKSSKNLEPLIISMVGPFRLRELTDEEQDEINKYKISPHTVGHLDYQVAFDRGEVKAETSWIIHFQMAAWQGVNGYLFGLYVLGYHHDRTKMVVQNETLPSKSFGVLHISRSSRRECKNNLIDGLKPSTCFGELEIKSLKDFYEYKNRNLTG